MEEQELRNNNAGDLTEIVAALEKEYGALRGQIEQLEEDMFSVRQAMRPTLKEEVGALRGQIEQLEGRLSVREAKRPTLKEEVSALRTLLSFPNRQKMASRRMLFVSRRKDRTARR